MNQPSLQAESARTPWQEGFRGLCRSDRSRESGATVAISWAATDVGRPPESRQIELVMRTGSGVSMDAHAAWVCRSLPEADWVASLVDSNCAEVLLTARVDESGVGRQLVLELAGLLTRRLGRSKPAIRVRFVPTSERRSPLPRR